MDPKLISDHLAEILVREGLSPTAARILADTRADLVIVQSYLAAFGDVLQKIQPRGGA
jgi:hypothetical protein